jgi:hypothetical protein
MTESVVGNNELAAYRYKASLRIFKLIADAYYTSDITHLLVHFWIYIEKNNGIVYMSQ